MTEETESDQTIFTHIPQNVLDFSSQYGSNHSRNYNLDNICKAPEIYPSYGDSTNALVFRTYGPWWINLPSYKSIKSNFKRCENEFTSRDFIEIEYPNLVHSCSSINIYETYNPGTLEVVYVGRKEEDDDNERITWHRVWKYPDPFSIVLKNGEELFIENGRQQMQDLFPDHVNSVTSAFHSLQLNTDHNQVSKIHTRHTYPPAARFPRITKISLENKVPFPIQHVRLEFDHCTANYYIEIDTITLTGSTLNSNSSLTEKKKSKTHEKQVEANLSEDLIKLPFDLLFLICSYLDLRSLVQLASTCRYLQQQCLHSLQFKSLNLQPYWNLITNYSIEHFFVNHCHQTRYLSLAWTKYIQLKSFNCLLNKCSTNLLQLNLACCQYLTREYIETIVNSCPSIEILNLDNCISLESDDFLPLTNLYHLRSLNVYRTNIDFRTLLPLIDQNKEHLEHLNLGSCQQLKDCIGIVRSVFARCSNLRSLDLWRASSLTHDIYLSIVGIPYDFDEEESRLSSIESNYQEDLALIYSSLNMPAEIKSITHMTCLSEIDIGWTSIPEGFVKMFVQQAGHSLIKLFLTACRHISNADIIAISENCSKLRQLDLLGSNVIMEDAIECVLKQCVHLEFLDLSFCAKISDATIEKWIHQYKNCFKRSFVPIKNEDVYHEFD